MFRLALALGLACLFVVAQQPDPALEKAITAHQAGDLDTAIAAYREYLKSKPADGLSTGVFIGLVLDPNTTNFHLRWAAGEIDEAVKDQVHPPLTANRTMGALGSVAASRIARFFAAGGPSFAVCDEEAGGLRALTLAANALRNGEIDRAIVGAVDFAADPRAGGTEDGAAAIVLKRLADAKRDGDRVYALVQDITAEVGEPAERPACGAATGLLEVVEACRDLEAERYELPDGRPAFWIHDRVDGPRRLAVDASNGGGFGLRVVLEEAPG